MYIQVKSFNLINGMYISISIGKHPSSNWRYAKIGAAAVVTGVVLGVTGGLAAPAIAGRNILHILFFS
jgi:hypothetical protein